MKKIFIIFFLLGLYSLSFAQFRGDGLGNHKARKNLDMAGHTVLDGVYQGDGSALTGVGLSTSSAVTTDGRAGENLTKGDVVYISGATGTKAQFKKADFDSISDEEIESVGVAAETKNNGQAILIRNLGVLTGIDMSDFSAGDELFLWETGTMTNVQPSSGAVVHIGHALNSLGSPNGVLLVHHETPVTGIYGQVGNPAIIRMGDGDVISFRDGQNNETANMTDSSMTISIPVTIPNLMIQETLQTVGFTVYSTSTYHGTGYFWGGVYISTAEVKTSLYFKGSNPMYFYEGNNFAGSIISDYGFDQFGVYLDAVRLGHQFIIGNIHSNGSPSAIPSQPHPTFIIYSSATLSDPLGIGAWAFQSHHMNEFQLRFGSSTERYTLGKYEGAKISTYDVITGDWYLPNNFYVAKHGSFGTLTAKTTACVGTTLYIGNSIEHEDDANTTITFSPDNVKYVAGGLEYLEADENPSDPDTWYLGDDNWAAGIVGYEVYKTTINYATGVWYWGGSHDGAGHDSTGWDNVGAVSFTGNGASLTGLPETEVWKSINFFIPGDAYITNGIAYTQIGYAITLTSAIATITADGTPPQGGYGLTFDVKFSTFCDQYSFVTIFNSTYSFQLSAGSTCTVSVDFRDTTFLPGDLFRLDITDVGSTVAGGDPICVTLYGKQD